jgi:hypothetical protein
MRRKVKYILLLRFIGEDVKFALWILCLQCSCCHTMQLIKIKPLMNVIKFNKSTVFCFLLLSTSVFVDIPMLLM